MSAKSEEIKSEADWIRAARLSYPNATSDIGALCLAASAARRHVDERNEAMNMNARQAQKIAALMAELAELRAEKVSA